MVEYKFRFCEEFHSQSRAFFDGSPGTLCNDPDTTTPPTLRDTLRAIGPGILFAGAAIGGSHLVQSTRAGADYGFALVWAVLLTEVFLEVALAAKFALGFAIVALGFFIYGAAEHVADERGLVSSWLMVWGYGAISLGELLVSGLGLAMVARYVPARMGGFMMGAYFVASGVYTVLGPMPPITGSMKVVKLLTEGLEESVGATFAVEPDPEKAAVLIRRRIENRREKLGLPALAV